MRQVYEFRVLVDGVQYAGASGMNRTTAYAITLDHAIAYASEDIGEVVIQEKVNKRWVKVETVTLDEDSEE